MIYLFRLMVKLELEKYLVSIPSMFFANIWVLFLYRFWVRLLSWNNLLLYIFQTFSSSFIIPYSTCFRSLPLSSLLTIFLHIIDTDNCTGERRYWVFYVHIFIEIVLKNFIDEFKFSFRVDSKNAFTNLFSKNWASLCIPLISWGTISIFPSSSRKIWG
jgi:hypothetical protein